MWVLHDFEVERPWPSRRSPYTLGRTSLHLSQSHIEAEHQCKVYIAHCPSEILPTSHYIALVRFGPFEERRQTIGLYW